MNKAFGKVEKAVEGAAKKFTSVSVSRGQTAYPKTSKDLERLGIRFDYDGEVTEDGVIYNKFQVQPNSGKIPSSFKEWRDGNGGTHAVMGSMYVKKGGTAEDVQGAFDTFKEEFKKESKV